jgi:hypothetical protein
MCWRDWLGEERCQSAEFGCLRQLCLWYLGKSVFCLLQHCRHCELVTARA